MAGIKTDELNTALQYIVAHNELSNDFDKATAHLMEFHTTIVQRDPAKPDRNIHALTSANGRPRGGGGFNDSNRRGGDSAESNLHNRYSGFEAAVSKRIA